MDRLYTTLWNSYNSSLIVGTNAAISSGLSAASEVLTACLTVFVIFQAVLILYGALSFGAGVMSVLRAMLVCAALTPVYFNTYLRDVFTDWLPGWIAGAVSDGATGGGGVEQFDKLRREFTEFAATVNQQVGLSQVAEAIDIFIAKLCFEAALLVTFLVWAAARVLMALVVSIGPFIIVLALFDFTRGVVERWIGKLLSLGVLLVLVSVLLRIVIVQEMAYIAEAGRTTGTISVQAGALWNIVLVVAVGALLLVTLPAIAAHIGGGVSFSVAPMYRALGGAAGAAARGTKAASAAAARAARRSAGFLGRRRD